MQAPQLEGLLSRSVSQLHGPLFMCKIGLIVVDQRRYRLLLYRSEELLVVVDVLLDLVLYGFRQVVLLLLLLLLLLLCRLLWSPSVLGLEQRR